MAPDSRDPLVAAPAPQDAPSEFPQIEGYDLIDQIGRGGMGIVYEAYQQSTGRRVSIKFMLAGAAASAEARRRFEREVELIARLEHPGIVSVLDSGIHRGNYYYVMEFVDGRPLDEAMTPGEGDPRAALRLMESVCQIVDYAHQRGVLHRDLKPSNILIADGGSSAYRGGLALPGIPKILDFGLAKAIDAESAGQRQATLSEQGQLIGTLGYMTPEQARGQHDQMSVRSDVYSLGAVAYELLTGQLPCGLDGPLTQVLGRIENRDPARPSSLRGALDADVDAILLKALEKSPSRRYATAGEMAADISRYLAYEPILARPAGPGVRLARWVRRNRAVAAISGLAVAVVMSMGISSFIRVKNERDQAIRLASMLEGILTGVDPDNTQTSEFTATDFLDQVAAPLEKGLGKAWETEARLREKLGIIYIEIGQYEKAEEQCQMALSLRRQHLKPTHEDMATGKFWVAATWWNLERYQDAEKLYREALETRIAIFGEKNQHVAESRQHLGACLDSQQRYREAEQQLCKALETQVELLGRHHKKTTSTRGFLGKCLTHQGRFREAQLELEEALRATEKNYGTTRSWRYARNLRYLAEHWRDRKEWDQALELARQALAIQVEVLPPGSRDAATTNQLIEVINEKLKAERGNRN